MKYFSVLLFLTLFTFLKLVRGKQDGAPLKACEEMTPYHGMPPQSTPSPYKLTVDKTKVSPWDKVNMTIEGKNFKGFMAQGRTAGGKSVYPMGVFMAGGSGDDKTIKCQYEDSSITHSSNKVKGPSYTVTWIAPKEKGKYQIFVTTAEDGAHFWVRQPSDEIEVV